MSEFKRLAIPHAGHERKRTQYGYSAYWTQASKFELMNRLGEYEDTGFTPEEIRGMIRDEPRVMTVEEVTGGAGTPAYMEARSQRGYRGWVLIYDVQEGMGITGVRIGVTKPGHITIWPAVELYGVKWRCWTGEPTEEQREAEPWM